MIGPATLRKQTYMSAILEHSNGVFVNVFVKAIFMLDETRLSYIPLFGIKYVPRYRYT